MPEIDLTLLLARHLGRDAPLGGAITYDKVPDSGVVFQANDTRWADFSFRLYRYRYGLLPWPRLWLLAHRTHCTRGHPTPISAGAGHSRRLVDINTLYRIRDWTDRTCFECAREREERDRPLRSIYQKS